MVRDRKADGEGRNKGTKVEGKNKCSVNFIIR
jgi:hypothetical protein